MDRVRELAFTHFPFFVPTSSCAGVCREVARTFTVLRLVSCLCSPDSLRSYVENLANPRFSLVPAIARTRVAVCACLPSTRRRDSAGWSIQWHSQRQRNSRCAALSLYFFLSLSHTHSHTRTHTLTHTHSLTQRESSTCQGSRSPPPEFDVALAEFPRRRRFKLWPPHHQLCRVLECRLVPRLWWRLSVHRKVVVRTPPAHPPHRSRRLSIPLAGVCELCFSTSEARPCRCGCVVQTRVVAQPGRDRASPRTHAAPLRGPRPRRAGEGGRLLLTGSLSVHRWQTSPAQTQTASLGRCQITPTSAWWFAVESKFR